jgi:hypothetical protein
MVFGPGKTMNWPKNDCSRAERSGIDPVLRPGLSLAQLQPGLDGAGPQLVVVNLKHRWPMLLSEKLWSFSVPSMLHFSLLSPDAAMARSVNRGTDSWLSTSLRTGCGQ